MDRQPDESRRDPGDDTSSAQGVLGWAGRPFGPLGPVLLPLRALKPAFAALHHRDYALVWSGSLLSNMGAWIQNVAKSWLVYELTGSALWLGIDAFAMLMTSVLVMPLGGSLADRMNRKHMLVACNLNLALLSVALALLAWTGVLQVWHLILVSVLMGTTQGLMVPANQSVLTSLIPRDDLPNAIALNAMQFNLSRLMGPAVGGVLLLSVGAGWSFMVNALTFLALIAALILIRTPLSAQATRDSILDSLVQGARYLRGRADLVTFMAMVLMTSFLIAPAMSMLPALVQEVYDRDASAYSLLLSCFGLGAVCGAMMLAARSRRAMTPWRAVPLIVVLGATLVALGLGTYATSLAGMVVVGLCLISALNRMQAATLGSVPDQMRGRMISYYILSFRCGLPLGALAAGALAGVIGVDRVFVFFGLLMMLGMAGIWTVVRWRRIIFRDESDAATA